MHILKKKKKIRLSFGKKAYKSRKAGIHLIQKISFQKTIYKQKDKPLVKQVLHSDLNKIIFKRF